MNNISEFTRCSNCGACYNSCPVDAITLDESDVFYKLKVDEGKCTSCGICKKVCPLDTPNINENVISAYGGVHKDRDIVRNSTSGGAFTAIANHILQMNGIVYGACYNNNCKEVVIKSSEDADIAFMRKSKYVESKVEFTFRDIKYKLNSGKVILFTGTPCQVAGLKKYLKKDYDNLYTCDFICGGVPSHHMYKDFIEGLEKKYKSKARNVDFRSKIIGWDSYFTKIDFENSKSYEEDVTLNPYLQGFIGQYITMRDYCYNCDFSKNHYSDIILADFWRYKELSNFDYNNSGLSMMLVNTKKGESLIQAVSENFCMEKINTEDAKALLKKLSYTKEHMNKRAKFILTYKEKGIFKAAKVFYKPSFKQIIRKKAKVIIRKAKNR